MAEIRQRRDFGEEFGTGLGEGLKSLVEGKLKQMQQRNVAGGIQAANKNITEEQAQALSNLDPSTLNQVLKQMQEQDFVNSISGQGQQNIGQQQIGQQQMGQQNAQAPKENVEPDKSTEESLIQRAIKQGYTVPTNRKAYNDLIKTMRDQDIEERKLKAEERKNAFKETKEIRNKARENADFYQEKLDEYDRMIELEKDGDLDTPGYLDFLKDIGLDINNLKTDSTQEFEKLVQSQIKDIGRFIKGSITNNEIEQFMKAIPNLSQSPEGRKRVLANLQRIARLGVEYYKTQKDIIRKNKGVPPDDLEELTDDAMEKVREKIGKQFKEDLKREVPKGESGGDTLAYKIYGGAISGAKSLGGTILHGTAKAIPSAIAGGIAGSFIPGLGNIGGAGLGALSSLFKE